MSNYLHMHLFDSFFNIVIGIDDDRAYWNSSRPWQNRKITEEQNFNRFLFFRELVKIRFFWDQNWNIFQEEVVDDDRSWKSEKKKYVVFVKELSNKVSGIESRPVAKFSFL